MRTFWEALADALTGTPDPDFQKAARRQATAENEIRDHWRKVGFDLRRAIKKGTPNG